MSRLPQRVPDGIESHLNLVLRPESGANDGVDIYRVYNFDVNTY